MDKGTKVLLLTIIASIATPLALIAVLFNSGLGSSELVMQALFLLIVLPLLALSVYMWVTGRGAMLIAGYNTSPKAVRELYDSRAMARFVGMLVTVFLVLLLVGMESLALGFEALFLPLLVAAILVIIAGLVYMNTGGRFLKEGEDPSKVVISDKDRKRNRAVMLAALGVIAVILVAVFFFSTSGSVSVSLEDDSLHVSAPFVDERIPYAEVTSVELRDTFDNGRRVGGYGGTEISSGNFQNEEFGRYTLARYNDVQRCIVVHHANGVLVFNLDTADGTARTFEDLRSRT